MKGMEGHKKKELSRDLSPFIASHWSEEERKAVDFNCPDLAIVGPDLITGFITELGVIPPAAMFGISLDYIKKIGL
jgi:ribose 1,5-bisphosphate isomerase